MAQDGAAILGSIRIVLTDPTEPEVVGSVCRAMKSMGITDLRLVGSVDFDLDRARIVAVHAGDILAGSKRYKSVADAVSDCKLVAGVPTNRVNRDRPRIEPRDLAELIVSYPGGGVAIVFGKQIGEFATTVAMPRSPFRANMRVSHAVQIICYEVFTRVEIDDEVRTYLPIEGDFLDEIVDSIDSSLSASGAEERDVEPLREILERAALSSVEARRFEALFSKLAGMKRSENSDVT